MSRIAVALSGGIDSAVAALLLLNQGHEVIGITGKMQCSEDAELIVLNAKKVADKLGIQHVVVDVNKEFNEKIIKYFINSYKEGQTPNPCIMCNKYIKWGAIFDYALKEHQVDYIATGHYANIKKIGDFYQLFPASDEHKDQLYFLFMLNQMHLAKTIFPLSDYKKDKVRELANIYNLPSKSAKESQDICFIKAPMTTKKYLNSVLPNQIGNFIEKNTGKILGKHDGYWQFTIGQRKGIGIASAKPLYVIDIDSKTNSVIVGYKEDLENNFLELKDFYSSYPLRNNSFEALVKIRYNMKATLAKISISNSIQIEFTEPISGITKGQACVIYDKEDGHLIGGGLI